MVPGKDIPLLFHLTMTVFIRCPIKPQTSAATKRLLNLTTPIVSSFFPVYGASLRNLTPTLSDDIVESGSGIDTEKSFFYLDDTLIYANASELASEQVSYTPDAALIEGTHTAYLRLYDKVGNKNETVWHFTVDRHTWVDIVAPLSGALTNQDAITLTVDMEADEVIT